MGYCKKFKSMKIKAYTIASPSHRELLDKYLIPSFPHNENVELTIKYIPQLCKTATFYEAGWHETMNRKVDCFIEGIESLKDDELFMFIDNDIVIFKDFYDDIINHHLMEWPDILFQNDQGGGCNSGLFFAKNNENVRNLMKATKMYLHKFDSEQVAITEYCFNKNKYLELKDLRWQMLPSLQYWTYGIYRKTWNGEDDFTIPKDIVMAHGNWCLYKDKTKLLDKIKEKYENNL